MAADSRLAIARAAPGVDLPLTPRYPALSPWSRKPRPTWGLAAATASCRPASTGLETRRASLSPSPLPSLPVGWTPRLGLSPRYAERLRFPGPNPSSTFGLGPPPPRLTASAEAYSNTRFRPSKRWFLGLTSAAVACSVLVKSTNAHLNRMG